MPGRDGRGPAGAGLMSGRVSRRNGRGICRRLPVNEMASGVLYSKEAEIRDLKRQAETLESSLDKINLKIKELDSKE